MQPFQDFSTFNPSGVGHTIAGIIFYCFAVVVSILGLSTVYVLIRNGRSKALSFAVSIVYLVFYTTLMVQGMGMVNSLP